ncbi:MAG: cysteine--tRNA ligase [Deltaproteobacteria bacterium]|nr:cysteine--tRNA ligase [Deltaproteobacteria bacterium]MCL4873941.1 cysteine--tRNA ligase [bacterium]
MASIRVFNSLTGEREEFKPKEPGKVSMYVCGPTVYDLSHIGHARSAVSFDAIQKYFRYRGYDVRYARNYTDVDDKIIKRAATEGTSSEVVAEKYIKAFDEDMAALGVGLPDLRPKATESIGKIIEVTGSLIKKGFAYEMGGDVYYSVRKKADYGKLSGKNIDELESGARVEVDERKKDPLDFALWKASKPGEPSWESPWGKGRPGWHIECSAMVLEWLGDTIDIHGGGKDLIFPHHENEIAQSEAATGKTPYARYWLHNGFVNIEKEKMSKSLGNILNIRDALKDHTAEAIRLFLLSSHYRSPIDYTAESLREAESAVERYYKTLQRAAAEYPTILEAQPCLSCVEDRLHDAFKPMDDDFNTAEVIGNLFKEITRMNKAMDEARSKGEKKGVWEELSNSLAVIREASKFLGVFNRTPEEYYKDRSSRVEMELSAQEIERLIAERNEARKRKDFARADAIRKELSEKGVELEDTPKGTTWSVRG